METCSFVSAPATRRQTTAGSSRRAREEEEEEEEAETADAKSKSPSPSTLLLLAAMALRRSVRRRRRCRGASGQAARTLVRGRQGLRGTGEADTTCRRSSSSGAVFIGKEKKSEKPLQDGEKIISASGTGRGGTLAVAVAVVVVVVVDAFTFFLFPRRRPLVAEKGGRGKAERGTAAGLELSLSFSPAWAASGDIFSLLWLSSVSAVEGTGRKGRRRRRGSAALSVSLPQQQQCCRPLLPSIPRRRSTGRCCLARLLLIWPTFSPLAPSRAQSSYVKHRSRVQRAKGGAEKGGARRSSREDRSSRERGKKKPLSFAFAFLCGVGRRKKKTDRPTPTSLPPSPRKKKKKTTKK